MKSKDFQTVMVIHDDDPTGREEPMFFVDYNSKCLCVIPEKPRRDFFPRHVHKREDGRWFVREQESAYILDTEEQEQLQRDGEAHFGLENGGIYDYTIINEPDPASYQENYAENAALPVAPPAEANNG